MLQHRIKASKRKKSSPARAATRTSWLWRGRSLPLARTLSDQCRVAYVKTVERFHGPVSRTAFNAACRATPDWDVVVPRAGLSGCAAARSFLTSIPCAQLHWCQGDGRVDSKKIASAFGVTSPPRGMKSRSAACPEAPRECAGSSLAALRWRLFLGPPRRCLTAALWAVVRSRVGPGIDSARSASSGSVPDLPLPPACALPPCDISPSCPAWPLPDDSRLTQAYHTHLE